MRNGTLVLLAFLVFTHATGLVTIGLVTTGSMNPNLPQGSIFLALHGTPHEGDLVVFDRANGDQAVHRVVDVTPEGLVTKGDANERTDQAAGEPPVDPEAVNVVPTIRGEPAALSASWLKPLAIFAAQGLAFTYAIHRLLHQTEPHTANWPLNQLKANHLFFASAILLLAASPFLTETLDADGQIEVQGLAVPTTVHVATDEGTKTFTVGPLVTSSTGADGRTEVTRAPAIPGASALSSHGSVWAMIPTALVTAFIGMALRVEGH